MTLDFQKNIIRYLFQRQDAKEFVSILDKNIFDIPLYTMTFEILQSYVVQYSKIPNKITILEAFDQEAQKAKINQEAYNEIHSSLVDAFEPIELDEDFAKDTLIDFARKQMVKKLFENNADKIEEADDAFFKKMYLELSGIVELGQNNKEEYEGKYLLQDFSTDKAKPIEGHPTYLSKLNKLTAARGFHTPQLVIFMGGPKSFKTGITLSIGVNYVRDGLKVFFADCENGTEAISNRAYQAMLGCTREELYKGDYDTELKSIIKAFKAMGGEMRTQYFPAHIATLNDVDTHLELLKEKDGFVPDLIIYDYLDLFASADKRISEKRLQIQSVYHHAIRLNNKWGTFCFSPSQVNKQSANKDFMDITSFSEDFGKAANAHAAFGIVGTEEDRLKGFASLIPVMQREGKRYSYHDQCPLVLDEERMMVEEDELFYERNVETQLGGPVSERPQKTEYTFGSNKN